ncbi:SpoIIE family protein phosphatase [candidate division KSB1 bacterium]|nr:SpoIIE family protein phosphatase [candidate division KSB1 bacterium]
MFRHVVKDQLRVPAKIEYLGELRDFVTKVGRRYGFSERVINAFKLSIDEAATNIIKHAYRDWEGDITIRAVVKKHSLTIVLIDQGKYFDPRQVSDPDLQRYVDIGKKGGLGIFIMRRLLDDIDYRKTEEGNELWLLKNRDVARKRKISVPSIPISLKVRYWLISLAVYTFIILAVYMFFFVRQEHRVLNQYLSRGRNASYNLASETAFNLEQLDNDERRSLIELGSQMDARIGGYTAKPVTNLLMSDHREIVFNAFIVDNTNIIIASMEEDSVLRSFTLPASAQEIQENIYTYQISHIKVVDIVVPVLDINKEKMCDAHLLIDYRQIDEDIKKARQYYFNISLMAWVIGNAVLFFFIYIIMNPFRRLQEWVKALGQPGVAEEMDIDDSTEVGEIAQAFSDITQKLRESQKNLAEQERLQKEMQVAKEIQQILLPSEFPEIEGYELASYYAAAKEVGGDYFDFVEVDKDTLGIVVGDVSGKGVPGSLVMTMIRTALRTEARGLKDAAEVLARVNDFIVNDMKKGMFVTLFYVIIDSRKRKLNYASAGHNPMILYRSSTNRTYYLNPRGFPIGISLPDKELFRKSIESDTISLAEDDILLVYTDGITEAMNSKRALFGEERFLTVIRKHGTSSATDFVNELHQEINSFTEGNPQNDDITLVAIKEKTTAEKLELNRAKNAFKLISEGESIKKACDIVGISTYAFNKYKEAFEKDGTESFEIEDTEQVEAKHLSIEEKTQIFDVIRRYPEYGAKRIAEELNTERYGFTVISAARIYEELVRSRLNTKELREAFMARGSGKRKRLKPPGTPLLTIDGQVIMQRPDFDRHETSEESKPSTRTPEPKDKNLPEKQVKPQPVPIPKPEKPTTPKPVPSYEKPVKPEEYEDNRADLLSLEIGDLLHTPLEDLFDKRGKQPQEEQTKGSKEKKPKVEPKRPVPINKAESAVVESEADQAEDLEIERPPERGIDKDEMEFADLIASGEGLDEPEPQEQDQLEFEEENIEDVEILSEAEMEPVVLETDDLDDPFEEFLEIERENGAIGVDELEIENELLEPLDDFFNDHEKWNIKEIKLSITEPRKPVQHKQVVRSFDELLKILENEKDLLGKDQDSEFDALLREAVSDIHMNELESGPITGYGGENILPAQNADLQRANHYYERQEYQKTIAILENLIETSDDIKSRLLLGNAFFKSGNFTGAARVYNNVLRQDSKNQIAYENMGIVFAQQGDYKKAISYWNSLLKLAPQRVDIQEKINRAKKYFNQSIGY